VILLSLALVVASAVALVWGIVTGTPPLVWLSLAAALVAGGLVAGSVVRRRERLALDPAGSPPLPPADSPARTAAPPLARPAAPPPPAPPYAGPPRRSEPASGLPSGPGPAAGGPPLPPSAPPPVAPPPTAAGDAPVQEPDGEPPVEDIPVRDALRVAQLDDEVLVVDGHPRYHLAGCPTLAGAATSPLPVSAARRGGFTPCGVCGPDRTLLARSRERRARPD